MPDIGRKSPEFTVSIASVGMPISATTTFPQLSWLMPSLISWKVTVMSDLTEISVPNPVGTSQEMILIPV